MSERPGLFARVAAAHLRHAAELAEHRDGEDRWEVQSRALDELGYRVVDKDLISVLPALAGALAEIAETVGLHRETDEPCLIVERVRVLAAEVERLRNGRPEAGDPR